MTSDLDNNKRFLTYWFVINSAATLQVMNFSMSLRKVLCDRMLCLLYNRLSVTLISVAALCSWLPLTPPKLFKKLVERNVPHCLIAVLCDWYDKLYAVVRWNGVTSHMFPVKCGVRRVAFCYPGCSIYIYVDDLMEHSGNGCYVGGNFLGCIMYADDLLLVSASVSGLQNVRHMLQLWC